MTTPDPAQPQVPAATALTPGDLSLLLSELSQLRQAQAELLDRTSHTADPAAEQIALLREEVAQMRQTQATQVMAQKVPGQRITVADLVDKVIATLKPSTRRAWASYMRVLSGGLTVGDDTYSPIGHLWADEVTHDHLMRALDIVHKRALIRVQERAELRSAQGREPYRSDGEGAMHNATGAWRNLFNYAVKNQHLHKDANPAAHLPNYQSSTEARWGLPPERLEQALTFIRSSGDDPLLDELICDTILITGARREGIINLTLDGLDLEESAVYLIEKNNVRVWQPAPLSLVRRLDRFARSRGAVLGTDKVFIKRAKGKVPAQPIANRRFDDIFCVRLQSAFRWADREKVTAHTFRHTAVTAIERHAGKAVAQAFARHKPGSVTDIYAKATPAEVAAAVCSYWGEPAHPWESRDPRLRR